MQTKSKLSLLVERSTGGFWTRSAFSWLQNTCTMLRGLRREISRSLYDLFGRRRGFGLQGLTCCVYGGHPNLNQDSADIGSGDNVDN